MDHDSRTRVPSLSFISCVCFLENNFKKIIFKIFLCLFIIKKVDQRKIFFSQRKI